MIYRILVDHRDHVAQDDPPSDDSEARVAVPWSDEGDRRLGGPGYGFLADVMQERGLRAPSTTNPRARYYFTERGWRAVGRHVAAEARRLGHVVRVVRHKNPTASCVIYRDELQVAILPRASPIEPRKGRAHPFDGGVDLFE